MKIKCLKRADTLFLSQIILFLVWGFQTRYIIFIIVTQRAEKLPEIEFEDMKKKSGYRTLAHKHGADQA